uniref:Anaphase-promoting complex subunit 4 WD40 domain-containing protein n=1 Tax=Mucochytrium quahogii TaxID=96639 RepID=A0A7S2RM78_9STRA|mmetsp:Transcript_19028/g.31138  ORF Transcript_19028/g.31138 Transcript_19028/m.31138 type:complete len:378 (+) Transcript_19028:171-1304(+)
MSTKRLIPLYTVSDNPSEVFSTRFSPDGKLLAAGCGDGTIRVYNSSNGRLAYELRSSKVRESMPVTGLRFRPIGASKTKNVLLAVNANGSVSHWHVTSGKCLHTIKDEHNQLYCVDYRPDGTIFATAGKDFTVRVYDEATKTLMTEMRSGIGHVTPGHSNRVFSLKFNPTDPNIMISGGWDNTVQIWDLRVEHAVRSIYGPHICGDAVDIYDNRILTGSWRTKNQLELWDYGSGEKVEEIPWSQSVVHSSTPAMLYSAQFSKGTAGMIAAGGTGSNEAKVFDRNAGNKLIGTVAGLSRGVYTVDFDPLGRKLAVAGGDTAIRILGIERKPMDSGAATTPRPHSFEGKDGEGKDDYGPHSPIHDDEASFDIGHFGAHK